jgi:hypothetical protein
LSSNSKRFARMNSTSAKMATETLASIPISALNALTASVHVTKFDSSISLALNVRDMLRLEL